MKIVLDWELGASGSVVALGMFDGVHFGHQVLLSRARVLARRKRLPFVVHTFSEHPLNLLNNAKVPPLLTTAEERAALMEQAGVDVLNAVHFTEEIRDMLPEVFIGELVRQWKPKAVVVGFNYSFGRHGAGTPLFLKELGHALGFQTYIVPAIQDRGQTISATVIRELIAAGNVRDARGMLDRFYTREYTVRNQKRGYCELQAVENGKLIPPPGLYRALADWNDHVIPLLLRIRKGNRATCRTLSNRKLPPEVTFQLMCQWIPSQNRKKLDLR